MTSNYKITVPMLAGLYPALFFIGNNSHIFSLPQNIVLTVFTSVIAVIVCLLFTFLLSFIYRYIFNTPAVHEHTHSDKSTGSAPNLITANISIIICFYLLRNTLLSFGTGWWPLLIVLLVVAIILSFIVHKKGLKILFNILLVFTVISAVQLSMNLFKTQRQLVDAFVPSEAKGIYEKLRFKEKPNVYLVITESYPNKAALREVYGIDNSPFYEKLEGLGFGINHNFFSNYNHTLASLPSMFAMEHHYGLISLGNLDSTGGRRILQLTSYNSVVSVFRNNGYKINYMHSVPGLLPNGAKADYVFPSSSPFRGLAIFLTHQKIMEPTMFSQDDINLDVLYAKIGEIVNNETPSFNFIYYHEPDHSPSRIKLRTRSGINRILSEFRDSYAAIINKENSNLLTFLESIVDNDRNSLIIVTGDHGSWGYRIGEDANGRKIPYQLYILDRFGVLAGVYGSKDLTDLMDNNNIKSHVNLFKYVFAYLSKDDKILETLRRDNSYDGSLMMSIKDNQILKMPVKVKFKSSAK